MYIDENNKKCCTKTYYTRSANKPKAHCERQRSGGGAGAGVRSG